MGLALTCVTLFGLTLELSRPMSKLGWAIRNVHDEIFDKNSSHFWRNGMLVINKRDVDVLVRTVIGEAAREPLEGKIAVVHVIMNRARKNISWYGGNNVADVAMHKATVTRKTGTKTVWQFEPWMSRKDYLWGISHGSTLYKNVERVVISCVNGTYPDPTDGATHFLEPNIVRSRTGGTLPSWAQGEGRRIGNHVFFKPYDNSI